MAPVKSFSLLIALMVAASGPLHGQAAEPVLFLVKRNTNANELDYRARLAGCRWAEPAPIHPVWRMLANARPGQPVPEEELSTSILGDERKVYGAVVTKISATLLKWHVKVAPEVEFTSSVSADGSRCRIDTATLIDGKTAQVVLAYVHYELLGTQHFTIYGCRDRSAVHRRIVRVSGSESGKRAADSLEASKVNAAQLCAR